MRVLVTGHLGYVGSVLAPLLRARGHEVRGIDSDLYRACDFGDAPAGLPMLRKDVRDIDRADLEGIEAIVHLAGLSNDPLGDLDPELTMEINHAATLRLAVLARSAGVRRMLYASSCSVYGAAGEGWMNEESPLRPVTPYAESKLCAEQDLAALADRDFCPVFLRAATVYGMSPRIRFDLVVNNLVAWARATGCVLLKSDGTAWRPLLHVEDLARAYAALLEAPADAVRKRAFNIGVTRDNFRIMEIAQAVLAALPGSVLTKNGEASRDQRSYRVDCSRIARELPQFQPAWNLADGIAQLDRVYARVGLSAEDFEGVRYQRVAHLKHLLAQGMLDRRLRWRVPVAAVPAL